ncbi:MAG: energy-coupling factor transporter ATPase [Clostridia bacterium]|nr:energy-coupling factor transporter ATPase [Clostridia bacterium]
MSEKLIEFRNVTYIYETDEEDEAPSVPALDGVNLTVSKGEFLCVLGHNGSGKSTLAKMCNAIFEPTGGDVTVAGLNTKEEENGDLIRRKVGMVFQNPDNQIVATIVEDDVAFGPENLGVEPSEIRRRVDEALKAVNMYDLRLRQPHNLSGGQKQRVAIAGVLAMQTEVIVLDEPTAMLDPVGRQEVLSTIHKLNKELGITVIMVTHFMEEAVDADRVIVMNAGRIVLDGTPREVFSNTAAVKSCGLDVPQSTELCSRLGVKRTVLTAQEAVEEIIKMCGGVG